jgi:outer membrane receptor protein involved in Fe transport
MDEVDTPNSFNNFGNAEMSIDIDSMNTISIYGSVSGGRITLKSDQDITTILPVAGNSLHSSILTTSKSEFPTKNIGVDFVRKFKENKEKEFSIKLYGEFGNNNRFFESYQDNPGVDRYIINNNYANNTQYTIQSDYVLPFLKGRKLEIGAKLILRKANSDYESLLKTNPADDYKLDPVNTNNFDYAQQVYSGYGSYNFKIRKWSFRTGLRLEHTEVDGSFTGAGTKVSQSYTNLIPNLQVTRMLSKAYTIVLGYSQRIQRPFINSLNPFVDNTDTLNISYGNPALHPQLIHSVSFQNRINKGKIFAGLTLTGSYSNDKVISIARYNNTTGVTTTTRENLGKELLLSLNGNITARFNKAWTLSINSNIAYLSIQNSLKASQQNNGISGSINVNNSYKINPKLTLSTFLAYFRSQVTIQGYSTGQVFYNLSASYKIFKEKMTIGLVTSRIFEKYGIQKSYIKDQNFSSENVFKFPVRSIGLSLTWNFGKLKENVSKKKGVNNDDVL